MYYLLTVGEEEHRDVGTHHACLLNLYPASTSAGLHGTFQLFVYISIFPGKHEPQGAWCPVPDMLSDEHEWPTLAKE